MAVVLQKQMDIASTNENVWIHDIGGSYTCPFAKGVNNKGKLAGVSLAYWCAFDYPADANNECINNPKCIGVACGSYLGTPSICIATKVSFVNNRLFNNTVTTYTKNYKKVNSDNIGVKESPGELTCANATNSLPSDLYCEFGRQDDAKTYCSMNLQCKGIICTGDSCRITLKEFGNLQSTQSSTPSVSSQSTIIIAAGLCTGMISVSAVITIGIYLWNQRKKDKTNDTAEDLIQLPEVTSNASGNELPEYSLESHTP